MWRRSMHENYGYFDESFKRVGDWEMWCRIVSKGAIFKKISKILGLYYLNPHGMSTDGNPLIQAERRRIMQKYGYLWGLKSISISYL